MLATKGTHGAVHTLQMAVAQGPSNHLISDKDARNPHWRKETLQHVPGKLDVSL